MTIVFYVQNFYYILAITKFNVTDACLIAELAECYVKCAIFEMSNQKKATDSLVRRKNVRMYFYDVI